MLVRKNKDIVEIASGYFNQIATLADDQDQKAIDTLLAKDYFTLDVKWGINPGLITPAGFHEMKGNMRAAEFLRKNGADVDYMGFGAAIRGDVSRADYLRSQYGANPSLIARGAAYSGYLNYAEWLVCWLGVDAFNIVLGLIAAKRYERAKEFITEYKFTIPHDYESEFWQAVGMTEGQLTPALSEIYALLDGHYTTPEKEKDFKKYQITLGAGLSGNYLLSDDADDKTKHGFYHGMIRGGRLEGLPDSYYQPKPLTFDTSIYFDLDNAVLGCNIDFLERCYEKNNTSRATRTTFKRWLYYLTMESNDLKLIRCVPTRSNMVAEFYYYGGELTNFRTPLMATITFKTLSFIFKTRNPSIIDRLDCHTFLRYLPNADMARHLLAFDDNIEFQTVLLEKFNAMDWKHHFQSYRHFDLPTVMLEANKIRTLMKKYEFSYDQSHALIQSADLRNLLLRTCKDITTFFDRNICSLLVTKLGNLTTTEAADLIAKIRYYRHTIQDILHIANHFKTYALTHTSEQSTHAAGIATALTRTRTHQEVVDVLSNEMQLLQNAKAQQAEANQSLYDTVTKSTARFFHHAKSFFNNDPTPQHLRTYQTNTTDSDYERLVADSITSVNSKISAQNSTL